MGLNFGIYLGFALKSLLVGVGDRRQETGDNPPLTPTVEGKTGEMGMSEEVGAKFCPLIFLSLICPKC
ncbi:MAG: hypothetical protein F6K18_15450 [Okeania sp. SIO2C2]|uniref:hypothetical protein n=1 Tax=Okeania sp. SIO2C2 TaxID=2607787 RepID=UPI0013B72431|nr:hypothetical protein [Okeania sp. SIO2C2]NEP88112.1 hypothetical protein [Okeania sp. SIO2C2]